MTDNTDELVNVLRRLSDFYRASMEDAGFSEEEIASIEIGVMTRQMSDVLAGVNPRDPQD